jgi:hypothetical protein
VALLTQVALEMDSLEAIKAAIRAKAAEVAGGCTKPRHARRISLRKIFLRRRESPRDARAITRNKIDGLPVLS